MTDGEPFPPRHRTTGADRLAGVPFLWGAGTSAHQVEGGNEANDWYDWERDPRSPCVEVSGDACRQTTRFPGDLALLAGLGLNCYRFSLEWSRIEPEPGRFSSRWLEHYAKLTRACGEAGLLAIPTLHHFTNPRWLAERGGWENPETAERFARYCSLAAQVVAPAAAALITINEPNMPPLLGYELGRHPPGRRDPQARERVTRVFLAAHRAAVRAIRRVDPEVPVGLALAMADWQTEPGGEAHLDAWRAPREDVFLTAVEDDDFLGVNTYTRHRLGRDGWLGNAPDAELTAAGYEFWPEALGATLRRAASLTRVPLIVTESGLATDHDSRRIAFIDRAVAAMRTAMADGVDVRGYLHWSALDNFEWEHGYAQRFGLIAVDRETQEREVKPSARHLGGLARASAVSARAVGSRP